MFAIPNIPDAIAREIYVELCRSLPPPPADTPETRAIREQHAMTAVAHLLPENAAEATLAAQIVAVQFHARAALQAASRPDIDLDKLRQCRAQAASMMRQAEGGIRTLLRMQAERQKAEDTARPAAMQRAGYWFRSASVADPVPEPAPASGGEAPGRTRDPEAATPPSAIPPQPEYAAMTPAERHVTRDPGRAAAMLDASSVPACPASPAAAPALVAERLAGTSPLLNAFRQSGEPAAA